MCSTLQLERFWACAAIFLIAGLLLGCTGPQQTGPLSPQQGTAQKSTQQLPAPLHVREQARESPEKTLEQGLDRLAQQLTTALPQDKKLLVAVLDFNDLAGNVSAFGRLVNEELVTKLFQTRRVRVVERGLLEKALEELKFNLSEVVDPSRAKQLGKQVGADAIVTGTITDLGNTVKINARLIGVEKGDILSAAGAEVTRTRVIAQLMSQLLGEGREKPAVEAPQTAPEAQQTKEKAQPKLSRSTSQEFSKIRVNVERLKVVDDQIVLFVNYINTTDEVVHIGLVSPKPIFGNRFGNTFIVDNEGNQYNFIGGRILQGGWYRAVGGHWGDGANTLTLQPRDKVVEIFRFKPEMRGKPGSTFDFHSEQAYVNIQGDRIYDAPIEGKINISIRHITPQ